MTHYSQRQIEIRAPNTKIAYKDGAVFIARHSKDVKRFGISAILEAGSLHESIPGLAHYIEHLCMRNADRHYGGDAKKYLLTSRGSLNAFTGFSSTFYTAEVDQGFAYQAIEVVAQTVCAPARNGLETFEPELSVVLAEIAKKNMDPFDILRRRISNACYQDYPEYIRPVLGTKDSVLSISTDDILSHLRSFYVAGHLIVSMEGPSSPDYYLDAAMRRFNLPQGRLERSCAPFARITPNTTSIRTDDSDTSAYVIFQIPPINGAPPHQVAANWIARHAAESYDGPIYSEMRRKDSSVYGFSIPSSCSRIETFLSHAAFDLTTESSRVRRAIEGLGRGIEQMITFPDFDCLGKARDNCIWQASSQLSGPKYTSNAISAIENGVIPAPDEILRALKNLSLSDVVTSTECLFRTYPCALLYVGNIGDNFPDHHEAYQILLGRSAPARATTNHGQVRSNEGPTP